MDESTLLQQFALVVKGYTGDRLDIGSVPLSLLQADQREQKSGGMGWALALIIIMGLLAATLAVVMFFSYFASTNKYHKEASGPGMQTPRRSSITRPHPHPRTDTRLDQQQQIRTMAPQIKRTPTGESSPLTTWTAIRAAPESSQRPAQDEHPKYTLQVPSLLNMRGTSSGVSVHHVRDAAGNVMLKVHLMLLKQEMVERDGKPALLRESSSGLLPAEYVSIYSSNSDEELAMCALGPGEAGRWECDLYRGDSELFGFVAQDGRGQAGAFHTEQRYVLCRHPSGERLLTLQGRLEERLAELLWADGALAAVVEPGPAGPTDTTYQVICSRHETFSWEVLLLLLGVDRLRQQTSLATVARGTAC